MRGFRAIQVVFMERVAWKSGPDVVLNAGCRQDGVGQDLPLGDFGDE